MQKWRDANPEIRTKQNRKHLEKTRNLFSSGILQRAPEKKCSLCKETKPASTFYLSNTNKDGLHGWCKDCSDKRTVENGHKRQHGITPDDFQTMLQAQNNCCAICKVDKLRAGKRRFSVDHCHQTKRVRGLLCTRCNTMIGNACDDIGILQAAIAYIKRFKCD